MEQMDALQDSLEKLVPKSLDEIFRVNRDKGQLSLASDAELAQLTAPVDDTGVRHTLTDWQILMLRVQAPGETVLSPRLTGKILESGLFWMTSHVLHVDPGRRLVKTRNSTYRVVGDRVNEDKLDLISICATLNTWGIGQCFAVPPFFF
jgi:hypothetical protein